MISEEIFKCVLDESRETVFIIDRAGTILYANKNAFSETGYSDFDGIKINLIYPLLGQGDKTDGELHLEDREAETFAYRANETCYPVRLILKKLAGSDLIGVFASDDTERRGAMDGHNKAMEDVLAATKMKNEFTANITHELRTPINGIKGMAEGLEATSLTVEQQEAVGIILHCCNNMSMIVNDLLDYSKIEAGKLKIENGEFSLEKLIRDTLSLHMGKISEKGLKLIVNISGQITDRIISDELRLGQILNNLLSNAVKFTSAGHIGVELTENRLEDGEIELFFLIIDTGIGISDDEKDKLFKSFSQVDGSITRRFGGTGLGLAITKQLVELMGGKISVDSQKGVGSTFSFTVTVHDANTGEKMHFPEGSFEFSNSIMEMAGSRIARPDYGNYSLSVNNRENGSHTGDGVAGTNKNGEPSDSNSGRENISLILDELEKLKICLDLNAWEKAEGFAQTIKNLAADLGADEKKTSFSMLLNVRKENYEKAMAEAVRLAGQIEALKE